MLDRDDRVDVVVVGSGPIGSAYAREILDRAPMSRVLLVEVGPALTDPPGVHLGNLDDEQAKADAKLRAQGPSQVRIERDPPFYERVGALLPGAAPELLERPGLFRVGPSSVHEGEEGLPVAAMSSAVGGMGVLWTASCPRPGGSEIVSFIPQDELDAAYERADELLGVDHRFNADAPTNVVIRRRLGEVFDAETPLARPVQPLPLAVSVDAAGKVHWSGVDGILRPYLNDERFELRPDTLARRIVLDGDAAVGVELEDRVTGNRYVQPAEHVVVAADALRTPQLLFASGIRPRALGRYLNDHLHMLAAMRLSPENSDAALLDDETVHQLPVGGTWVPFVEGERPFHGQFLQVGASPAQLANRDAPLADMRGVIAMSWYATKEIQASDRVEFSDDDVDGYGMPAMSIRYTVTDTDRETLRAMSETMGRAANALGDMLHPEPMLMPWGNSLHYQGTARMGAADDQTSVCDSESRVWGYRNVLVGGNCVIPTPTACNPTITSVALAVRGARGVAAEIRAHAQQGAIA